MREQTLELEKATLTAKQPEAAATTNSATTTPTPRKWRDFLWTLPQPILVLGSMFAVATAFTHEWTDPKLFALIMMILPLPLVLFAEQIWTKRQDWLLTPKELAEDGFWLALAGLIWVPLYSDYYQTPISEGFKAIRDATPLNFKLEPQSIIGLMLGAILVRTLAELIYYWLHRVQHESVFWWRIHATHHHMTKMGAARGDRTHPLEFAALMIATPIILALTGASDDVIAVTGAFGMFNAILTHSNLPLRSGVYGLFFTTAEMHHLHHSRDLQSSNSNYGCAIIVWDRLFGTFNGGTEVEAVGAGTGQALDIPTQLKMAFVSEDQLTKY
jgi:sterol desaturase/sphingolipid hydroxylase (fatty acid hydroxylase superfamily)